MTIGDLLRMIDAFKEHHKGDLEEAEIVFFDKVSQSIIFISSIVSASLAIEGGKDDGKTVPVVILNGDTIIEKVHWEPIKDSK